MINCFDYNDSHFSEGKESRGFYKHVEVTVSRDFVIHTMDYEDHVDCDGNHYATPDNVSWIQDFEYEYPPLPKLLEELRGFVELQLNQYEAQKEAYISNDKACPSDLTIRISHLKKLISMCNNWVVECVEIE